MLTFGYPWLWLLLPLPWVLRMLLPSRTESQLAVRVPFGDRLSEVIGEGAATVLTAKDRLAPLVAAFVWLFVLMALARPQWIEPPLTRELPTRDLLLLVDLSSSMDQKDFQNQAGETIDRLTAVKQVLGDFLVRRQGDRVGLVVFGDAPYLQAPFSTDLDLSRQLLDECQVGMAGPRTALGDAIGLGVGLFEETEMPAKTMIALTDGNDTKSLVPPVEAARVAAQRGIHIHTVAIGDPTTVGEDKLDEQALKDVAAAADGSYFFAADRDSLAGIYAELDQIETREVKTVSHRPRRDLYYVPLLVALFASILANAWRALANQRRRPTHPDAARNIRVNPSTGELELEP